MRLYDEDQIKQDKKKSERMSRILIVSIVLITIIIIGLICLIFYLINHPNRVTINLNGKESAGLEQLIQISTAEDGNTTITAPIKDIATYFNYDAFNGGYTTVSEDTDSCYVESENEIAIFNLDSDVIYKLNKTVTDAEYEYCHIDEPVFKQDEKLYTTQQGLENAFNIYMYYNVEKKTLDIYTLDTLVATATSRATGYGYTSLDETFENQKAILEDMMVVISSNNLYGVVSYSTGEEILGAQYDLVTYIPQKSAFLVQRNNKVGIIASDGTTKITPNYDSLILIDNERELYLAQNDGLYGVVDINGNTVIYLEYDKIGVDIAEFEENDLKTGYILLDTLIPVQQDGKWGFFDKEGKQVTDLIYDSVGCITTNSKSVSYNLLTMPECNVIVVGRDKKYTFIDLDGKELFDSIFDDVYMELASGEEKYYVVVNDTAYDAVDNIKRAQK